MNKFMLILPILIALSGKCREAAGESMGKLLLIEIALATGDVESHPFQTTSVSASWPIKTYMGQSLQVFVGSRFSNYARSQELNLGPNLTTSRVDIQSLNFLMGASYLLTNKLAIGMNIDLLGLSIGNQVSAKTNSGSIGMANPKSFNLLLGGARDLGALNSEFFIGYRATDRWMFRAGLSHQVIEYESSIASDKAQKFFDLVFFSVGYSIDPL